MSSEWHGIQLVLALDAPLHLGWRLTGNLKQTRRFVPGRALWGAITDRHCRLLGQTASHDFEEAGHGIHRNVRFTSGFISDSPDVVTTWPWSDEDYFDWKHLQSYASTSLVEGGTAEAGSLHETEYLAPFTREGRRVYLHLLLWRRDGFEDLEKPEFWRGFQLGGERGYGWGRMHRAVVCSPFTGVRYWSGWRFTPGSDGIQVSASGSSRPGALSHVLASHPSAWSGPIEPLVGRITIKRVPGREVSPAEICFIPGSTYLGPPSYALEIGQFGIWKPVDRSTIATV